jgi:hypothetical protein
MPDTDGHYPDYDQARMRYWQNRAQFEKQARSQGKAPSDPSALDPIRSLSDADLEAVLQTGKAPPAPGLPGRTAELEHTGVPRRIAKWLEALGFKKEEAWRLAEVSNPNALLEVTPLEHAFFDGVAWRFGRRRADVGGARWGESEGADERITQPLARMSDDGIRRIVQEANARHLNFNRNAAARKLRDALRLEINARGLNVPPL